MASETNAHLTEEVGMGRIRRIILRGTSTQSRVARNGIIALL